MRVEETTIVKVITNEETTNARSVMRGEEVVAAVVIIETIGKVEEAVIVIKVDAEDRHIERRLND